FNRDVRERGKESRIERSKGEARRFENKKGGARFFPQAGLNWRWPFISSFCDQSVVLQPVGQLITAPDTPIGVKSRRIPNEDSTDFEFNDANLFSLDRFPGYDLIDTGSRGIYGGELLTTGNLFGDIEVFLGQSYSFSKPKHQDKSQGFGRRPSDYVGRIEANPYSWLTLNYRFRLDQKTLNPRVSEVGGSIGPDIARLAGDYVFISKHAGTADKRNFNQLNLTLSSKITKYWTLVGMLRQDLNRRKMIGQPRKNVGGGPLERGIGAVYRDDCFGLGLSVKRQFYKDRDLRPATIFLVTLFLKNIGDYNYSFNIDQGLFGERAARNQNP
ncbi:MAG TPA: LPS assembly protein LptD, partial [Alphaproteobacteria bacterium]|nr:LPS assembly protein LptD [Alphaproteobacteria bacterium]